MGKTRRSTAIALIVAMVVGVLGVLATGLPVAAAPQPFALDLVEGALLVRDAEEPYALGQPTRIAGQHDTGDDGAGTVTQGTFSSPTISFETQAEGQDVFVDATFSQITPASGTGSIDADGNVSFRTDVTVDLHLEINDPPSLVQECRTTPVSLALDSVAPYDPTTQQVTLRDPDFSVPPAPVTDTCISLVAQNVNELLAGSGHSLTMTMEGELELPPPAGCPTSTALQVAPASSFLGDEVTLSATVTADPDESAECDAAEGVTPSGSVEFRVGDEPIDVVALDGSGHAVLVTDDIPAGDQQLVARYRAAPPYRPSTSAPVPHLVAVRPLAVVDAPASIPIGGAAQEILVEVTNTGLGSDVINGRLDLAVSYQAGGTAPVDLIVEWHDGSQWVPAPVAGFGAVSVASVMPATGIPLPVGAEVQHRVRIAAGGAVTPGRADLTFELIEVDPGTGDPAPAPPFDTDEVATAAVSTAFVTGSRVTPEITLSMIPHTLRQGMSGSVQVAMPPVGDHPSPTGRYEMLLDGAVIPIRLARTNPGAVGYQPSIPVPANTATLVYVLPDDAATGAMRQVTIRYSGDPFYRPTHATDTVSVLPSVGASYACTNQNAVFTEGFAVNVSATALLPDAAQVGRPLRLDQLDIELAVDRGVGYTGFTSLVPPTSPVVEPGSGVDGFEVVDFGFGDLGTGTATAVNVANATFMDDSTRPVDPAPDTIVTFDGESAELVPTGAPGETLSLEVERLDLVVSFFGGAFLMSVTCEPVGDPVDLGDVVIAGTTLTVDAPQPTRVGDAVTLRAAVAPVGTRGTVELRDGTTTLSVVPVGSDGTVSYTTVGLGVGTHQLTARFRSGAAATSSVSSPVTLVVLPAFDCEAFTVEGDSATVRLAYLVLAGRCPSAGEHAYWVGRLGAGTSPAVLARALARSLEGYGQLVDRAYEQVLGRSPDVGGRAFWAQQLRNGYRIDRLMASMAASPEFSAQAGGTDAGFVDLLYERILDRAPEPAGAAYWTGELAAGVPRWRVARAFTGAPETRRQLTVIAYEIVLGRAPSASEAAAGVALLAGGDLARLYERLAGGAEFVTRADELPNPLG